MAELGYLCTHAPKPNSPCLEMSDRADGCALFIRSAMFTLASLEVFTYFGQNQVGIIAVLEPCHKRPDGSRRRLVLATTHLKAAKSLEGEQSRAAEASQLLDKIQQVHMYFPS
jgi:hypothetical protein